MPVMDYFWPRAGDALASSQGETYGVIRFVIGIVHTPLASASIPADYGPVCPSSARRLYIPHLVPPTLEVPWPAVP